jgi:AbrB family looped-hinge helix DNA binding protein
MPSKLSGKVVRFQLPEVETFSTRVDDLGRVVLPVKLRKKLGLEPGADVLLVYENGSVVLTTPGRALAESRRKLKSVVPAGVSLASELIRERREEAERG